MRISRGHKLIFISIPKTGSLSGFNFMEDAFNAQEVGWYHNVIVPAYAMKYKKFTFVRNPYNRFVSLYHAMLVLGGPKKKYKRAILKYTKKDDILSFAKLLARRPAGLELEMRLIQPQHIHIGASNVTQ